MHVSSQKNSEVRAKVQILLEARKVKPFGSHHGSFIK